MSIAVEDIQRGLGESFIPDEARSDPVIRSWVIALEVLDQLLGRQWLRKHAFNDDDATSYLRFERTGRYSRWLSIHRTIDLGEMLFNLQYADGFEGCLSRLKSGQIEATYAELETAKLLHLLGLPFRFVMPSMRRGLDYDIEIRFPDGTWVCADTKSKHEFTVPSAGSIRNSLGKARRQLPAHRPGMIFLRLPQHWIESSEFPELVEAPIRDFLHNSSRVTSVKIHTLGHNFDAIPQTTLQYLVTKEYDNPNCRFHSVTGWKIFDADARMDRWFLFRNYNPFSDNNPTVLEDHMADKGSIQIEENDAVPEIFCDGALGFSMKNGVVRTNLISERLPINQTQPGPRVVPVARVAMGLPAFLQMCRNFQMWTHQLEQAGLITSEQNPFSSQAHRAPTSETTTKKHDASG